MTLPNMTGGPWTGGTGESVWTLTIEEVAACLAAMPDKRAMATALGCVHLSSRKADRALQLLRRAGLARHRGGKWTRVQP